LYNTPTPNNTVQNLHHEAHRRRKKRIYGVRPQQARGQLRDSLWRSWIQSVSPRRFDIIHVFQRSRNGTHSISNQGSDESQAAKLFVPVYLQTDDGGEESTPVRDQITHSYLQDERIQHIKTHYVTN
jgi:hypothetical protein